MFTSFPRRVRFTVCLPRVEVAFVLAPSVRSEFPLFLFLSSVLNFPLAWLTTPSGLVLPVHHHSSCSDSSPIFGASCISVRIPSASGLALRHLAPFCTASPLTTQGIIRSAFRESIFNRYDQSIKSVSPTSVRSVIFFAYQLVRNVATSIFGLNSFFFTKWVPTSSSIRTCVHLRHVGAFTESKQIQRSPYVMSRLR